MPRKKDTDSKKEKVVKEKAEVNLDEIKKELYEYTDETVRKYYLQEIEKVNKIIIREKNKKILFRNFIITLLLLIIVFLLYLLNSVNYFAKFSDSNPKEDEVKEVIKEKEIIKEVPKEEEKKEPTLSELKETYSYLLNNIIINEESSYLKDYYSGNLTNELKNYLALNIVDLKKVDDMDDYNMFSDALIKASYEELFSDNYKSISFNYNGNQIRYISKLNSYISNDIIKKIDSNIKREITAIKVDNNKVTITTVEGLIKEDKLYNVLDNKEISDYKKDSLVNYQDKLNKLTYTYEFDKLISIK